MSNPIASIKKGAESIVPESLKGKLGVIVAITTLIIILVFGILYINYTLSGKISQKCKFLDGVYSRNIKIESIAKSDNTIINTDYQGQPIINFYIKTSYNSCSIGGYINDNVDVCILKDIIGQGVRCFDFEIFNLKNEAIVSTSTNDNPWMKETYNFVRFYDVLTVLVEGAMVSGCNNTRDPLFISLRMKTKNVEVYNDIASHLKYYTNQYLLTEKYNYEHMPDFGGTVTIDEVVSKIVIIVQDLDNSNVLQTSNLYYYTNIYVNKNVYFKFNTFTNLVNDDKDTVIEYTKLKTDYVTPDIFNGTPSNPEPASCLARGVQFIGMSYQIFDSYLQGYEYFFDSFKSAIVMKNKELMFSVINQSIPNVTTESPKKSITIDIGNGKTVTYGGGMETPTF
jgi:hypothetical protein